MTIKYCPHCGKLANARVLAHYTQIPWKGILVKQRRVVHMVEDGGCGLTWYTVELPHEMLDSGTAEVEYATEQANDHTLDDDIKEN